jgi:hypothetical protein
MQMQFENIDFGYGTSLVGYVDATYEDLCRAFGEPTLYGSGDDKVDFEWKLRFEDGVCATIYNWKDYDGGYRCRNGEVYNWHIGGYNRLAVANVLEVLDI